MKNSIAYNYLLFYLFALPERQDLFSSLITFLSILMIFFQLQQIINFYYHHQHSLSNINYQLPNFLIFQSVHPVFNSYCFHFHSLKHKKMRFYHLHPYFICLFLHIPIKFKHKIYSIFHMRPLKLIVEYLSPKKTLQAPKNQDLFQIFHIKKTTF